MPPLLTIGEFSRATHLSVKALRHYDDVGLLAPADVDPSTGYRRYSVAQVPVAHVIRRFRDLDMPLDRIREVITADDPASRDRVVLAHLEQMQAKLVETEATVAALHALLENRREGPPVEHRTLRPAHALAIRAHVDWDDAETWLADVLGELRTVLGRDGLTRVGPDGALYPEEFFELHEGEVVAFVPVAARPELRGPYEALALPAATCAVMVHRGPFATLDITYGNLGTYVTERAIGASGPIRENYLVMDARDPAGMVTEVCWPVIGAPRDAPASDRHVGRSEAVVTPSSARSRATT